VDAEEAGQAVAGHSARLALAMQVAAMAGLRIADVRRLAVLVLRAGPEARGRSVADIGRAGDRGRGVADARSVARPGVDLRRLARGTGGGGADRARAVEAAGALAVAEPVGVAAGRTLVRAAREDVDRAGGDVAADAARCRERARLADPRAGRLAADALLAEIREALGLAGADR